MDELSATRSIPVEYSAATSNCLGQAAMSPPNMDGPEPSKNRSLVPGARLRIWLENAGNFLESWKDNPYGAPFISDGMWKVVRKRPYRKAEEVIVKECDQLGAGKDLRSSTMKVYGNDDTLDRMDASILTEILDPRYPWEN